MAALRGLPIIAWREIPWSVFLKKVPDSQRHLFEPHYKFNEVEMVKQAVEKDVGIAVLPEATVMSELPITCWRHVRLRTAVCRAGGRHLPEMPGADSDDETIHPVPETNSLARRNGSNGI